jgi:3-oxoacyl-[acyl-carrier protein] reductase
MPVLLALDNRVALITGGSRGIGAAVVRRFVQAGGKVVFNYQRAQDAAAKLAAECGPERCHAVACDLTGTETARFLVDATVARFGRLDILIANHGVWPPEDVGVENLSDAQWRNTLAVNLDSVFALIKHAVAQMKRQPQQGFATGHIVLIASTSGQRGEAFHLDYSASKGALISMTKTLSSELIRSGIYVNSVAPGWVETDMVIPALQKPDVQEEILHTIPLGRVGQPDEIAAPVLFLCTEHASFISGEIFNVNGGAVLIG